MAFVAPYPNGEYVPDSQDVHVAADVAPVAFEYFPGWHLRQYDAATPQPYVPAMHLLHTVALAAPCPT